MGKIRINGQKQMFLQHTLNNIFRRAYHIEVLMAFLYLRQHDFVDVECLINDTDILPRLLLIIRLKIFEYTISDIIRPIINLENPLTGLAGVVTPGQTQH